MHGEEYNSHSPVDLPYLAGGFNPVEQRHRDIGDDDIGPQHPGSGNQGASVHHFAYNLEVRLQNAAQAFEHNRVVVSQ
jgi:hypothetical protein